ncbi:RNA polymerase sigma-70 factor [Lihuaxuella thermophila]|uniref:RNA polymerase sigma-70 factor, ECF subfamily n=1 Tax=Lihuaxuella thermophila TaxID=1173111 RepID=A0A1H8H6M0_9BACL|nr:RNA polymerase sigma-70 factor [Lihuaxuella thermophila]SEN51138.1 RNA polymerase sigma-70 factor, ECF subfamily [Lihuaxuella thermophila]
MSFIEITPTFYQTYKPLLFSLAYRLLGSVTDAEDMVHEIFISCEKVKRGQVEDVKAYLCKMITNRCLDYLKSARKQRESYMGPWLPEPIIIDEETERPDRRVLTREYLSIAYLVLMERLTATERAVFVLREVFQFDYREIAEIVEKSEENCRKIFSRAKQKLDARDPEPSANYKQHKGILERFVQAIQAGDKEAMLRLLSKDVILYTDGGGKVKAAINPIQSSNRVLLFLQGVYSKNSKLDHSVIVNLNGTPGLLLFRGEELDSTLCCKFTDQKIEAIYIVRNPDKLHHIRNHIGMTRKKST